MCRSPNSYLLLQSLHSRLCVLLSNQCFLPQCHIALVIPQKMLLNVPQCTGQGIGSRASNLELEGWGCWPADAANQPAQFGLKSGDCLGAHLLCFRPWPSSLGMSFRLNCKHQTLQFDPGILSFLFWAGPLVWLKPLLCLWPYTESF